MIALLAVAAALAQDTKYVPSGTTATAVGPAFVVPEWRMDELLARARTYDELLEDIRECSDAATEALGTCTSRFDEDARLIQDLQADAVAREGTISRMRQQRNVAITVSLGILGGATAAMVVSRR